MYLSLLGKKEKDSFLRLAYELALIDGDYGAEEQQMMEVYCNEMQISSSSLDKEASISTIIDFIAKESDIKNKKIMIFEIIGLAMSDSNYDYKEKNFIYELMNKFMIEEDFGVTCEDIISEYISFQNKINSIIME